MNPDPCFSLFKASLSPGNRIPALALDKFASFHEKGLGIYWHRYRPLLKQSRSMFNLFSFRIYLPLKNANTTMRCFLHHAAEHTHCNPRSSCTQVCSEGVLCRADCPSVRKHETDKRQYIFLIPSQDLCTQHERLLPDSSSRPPVKSVNSGSSSLLGGVELNPPDAGCRSSSAEAALPSESFWLSDGRLCLVSALLPSSEAPVCRQIK